MAITGQGWEFYVQRLAMHRKGSRVRTFGRYQVFIDGVPQPGLEGYVCEAAGPGDNTPTGKNRRRVEEGSYPLYTQYGRYRSMGYSSEHAPAGNVPMPGFRLQDRGVRTDILVHPGHPPTPYLSSIGCLNLTAKIDPAQDMNFWDSRGRVIAVLDSLRRYAPAAFQTPVNTKIPGAFAVIEGEPAFDTARALTAALPQAPAAVFAASMPTTLPISEVSARACATWLEQNFGPAMRKAARGKPYGPEHLAAIVCQETAYKWVPWIGKYPTKIILARAVYDASGDYPATTRSAFPVNTAAFRAAYGNAFTAMLIDEANETRALQGRQPQTWVYKGYGLFQYDLQHVRTDRAFFETKRWYDFDACLEKCTVELDEKLIASGGDLWDAIRRYNGSGPRAQKYMENVRYYTPICEAVFRRGGPAPALTAATMMLAAADAAPTRPSGPDWVAEFPDLGRVDDLETRFAGACKSFIAALEASGATVVVHSTRRPKERAYLMNAAWRIAREGVDPARIEDCPGVSITWLHRRADGSPDIAASRTAAAAMLRAYGIVYKPSLTSHHIKGKAIDMSIRWQGTLRIDDARGRMISISRAPRDGMNETLWAIGKSYGVIKLPSDQPHWSEDGH